jgi:hypothetical protein
VSNLISPSEQERSTSDNLSTWDEVRRIAEELELKIHLASMNARDRWQALEPRIAAFELRMKDSGQRASEAFTTELEAIWNAMRGIRDDLNGD